jgi:hypothetical protein
MRELVQDQAGSGLTLKAFAAREGVPYTTLWWWRRRLASTPRLVPVRVQPTQRASVEIVVGDVVVRVADADEGAIVRLVRALGSC